MVCYYWSASLLNCAPYLHVSYAQCVFIYYFINPIVHMHSERKKSNIFHHTHNAFHSKQSCTNGLSYRSWTCYKGCLSIKSILINTVVSPNLWLVFHFNISIKPSSPLIYCVYSLILQATVHCGSVFFIHRDMSVTTPTMVVSVSHGFREGLHFMWKLRPQWST